MRKILLYSSLLISTASCVPSPEPSSVQTIKINPSEARDHTFDDIISDYKILPFEDSVIMGEIVNIHIVSDYIFLHDRYQSKIHIYNLEGEHINTLDKTGKGPQEYLDATLYAYDSTEHALLVNSCEESVNTYSLPDLQFISKQTDPNSYIAIAPIDSIHLLGITNYDETGLSGALRVQNRTTRQTTNLTPQITNSSGVVSYSLSSPSSLFTKGDSLFYCHASHTNTVYHIGTTRCTPILNIDFGDWNLAEDAWGEKERILSFEDEFFKTNCAIKPQYFILNDTLIAFWYWHSAEMKQLPPASRCYVHNKRTHQTLSIDKLRVKDTDLTLVPLGIYNGYYIALVEPSLVDASVQSDSPITQEIIAKAKNRTSPLLVLFKLNV